MKRFNHFISATTVALFLFSCQKNIQQPIINEQAEEKTVSGNAQKNGIAGYVYTASNQVAGNSVLVYSRAADGTLSYLASYTTGGTGTGGGLGNQGAVALTEDHSVLLVVNAGSNSVSSFTVSEGMLELKSTVPSGGIGPVSITAHSDLVYVLNAGGSGNISGFNLRADGTLHPLAGSIRPLSSMASGAAQISFTSEGNVVVITEKATNKIISYTINASGLPVMMHSITSSNPTPFGFAVGKNGIIYVSEAVGGAVNASTVSSYYVAANGVLRLADGPVGAGQTAACWVVVTNNGKYVYDTNTGSGTVSSFRADNEGNLDVLEAIAGVTGMGTEPIDAALSNNSKFLYVLNAGNETISVFALGNDGSLDHIQNVTGLPDGATGIIAK
jgi:6-phosphogluconolactonase